MPARRALFETRPPVQNLAYVRRPHSHSTTPPAKPGRELDPSRCSTAITDRRRPLRRGLSRTTATPSRRVSSARTTSDATCRLGSCRRPTPPPRRGRARDRESDTTRARTTTRWTRATKKTTASGGRRPADSPPRPFSSSLAPRRFEIATALARSVRPSPTLTRPFPSRATTQGR